MAKQRPIDAPAPPWRLMPVTTDEVPIPNIDDEGEETTTPPDDGIDKAELARQLAEKARADIDAKKQAEAEAKKKKSDLAAELAAKAKAEIAAKAEAEKAERDKKAQLAKELAEKAKARHTPGPAPEAAAPPKKDEDRDKKAQLAKELAEKAKARHTPGPTPAAKAPPKKAQSKGKTPSLAQRAGRPKHNKMSAQEALAAALAAEEAATAEPKKEPASKKKAAKPAPKSEAQAAAKVGEAAPERKAHPSVAALAGILPAAQVVGEPLPVSNPGVFVALWKAHLARARKAQDPALIATATQLLRAVDQTELTALHAVIDDQPWAVWLDAEGSLIAAAQPAETYLKGL